MALMMIDACVHVHFWILFELAKYIFIVGMLSGWHNWLGRHSSAIWNLAPLCVMWSLWQERNRRIFEDEEKSVSHLQEYFSSLLFDCARSWGFTEVSSLPDFVVSLTAD
jgi:hypothetical protein